METGRAPTCMVADEDDRWGIHKSGFWSRSARVYARLPISGLVLYACCDDHKNLFSELFKGLGWLPLESAAPK